jgi:hypothetical protein
VPPAFAEARDAGARLAKPAIEAVMQTLRARSWSPYVVGAAIGVLSWFAFATAGRGIGITTPFEHTAALVIPAEPYAAKHTPVIGWEWMLVVGVFLGGWLGARLASGGRGEVVPPLWRARFGGSTGLRLTAAFAGGAILMFGARVAQGCTSGHGITGALQLAVSSWIFIAAAFGVAAGAARLLYGKEARHG